MENIPEDELYDKEENMATQTPIQNRFLHQLLKIQQVKFIFLKDMLFGIIVVEGGKLPHQLQIMKKA